METSVLCTSGVMRHIRDEINAYDASDKAVGIEAKVEVDV